MLSTCLRALAINEKRGKGFILPYFKMISEVDGAQNTLHTMFPHKEKLKRITN